MATVVARSFETVLALPVAKIQSAMASWSVTPSDTTRCFSTLASDEEIAATPPDDRFITVKPKDFAPHVGMQAGAGVHAMRFDGSLQITIWNRLNIDQATRDDSWLTNATLGIVPLMTLLVRALEMYYPTDVSGDYYFLEPLRMKSPGFVFPQKEISGWGRVQSDWAISFHFAFS